MRVHDLSIPDGERFVQTKETRRQEIIVLNGRACFGHALSKCDPTIESSSHASPWRPSCSRSTLLPQGASRCDAAPAKRDQEEEFGATARVEAPPREVTKRTLEAKELTAAPGTFGDALRAIEVLPGVAMPPTGQSQPLIRGSNFQDSQVFFDGAPVPILYHFGNFRSFVNSRLLERIEFYPGNFSTRYGRVSGGVIEVRPRDPRQDRWGGVVDVSLLDSSALVEGPIGPRASMAFAARRSNVDLVFKSIAGSGDFDTSRRRSTTTTNTSLRCGRPIAIACAS